MLATAFVNCVEEPSTCVQEGPTPVVASDPSGKKKLLFLNLVRGTVVHSIIVTIHIFLYVAFLTASTHPTSIFQPSPPLLPWNNLLENLSSHVLSAVLGIGIFIFILSIVSCWYKRRKTSLNRLQPEEIIGRFHWWKQLMFTALYSMHPYISYV